MSDACQAYPICSELVQLLENHGYSDQLTPLCDGAGSSKAWPCDGMVSNARLLYSVVSPENFKEVLRFVSRLFTDKSSLYNKDMQELTKDAEFSCPELGVDIHQPCSVTTCAFYTDNSWTKNCILCYRLRYRHENLSLNDLSVLLKRDAVSLRTQINKTIKGLSHGALKETIIQDGADQLITHLDVDRVCGVCEKSIPIDKYPLIKGGFCYCSDLCYKYKPPVVLKIERDFGLPIPNVLQLCIKKFSNLKSMANAIGVGQPVFTNLCQKYNIDIPSCILA